MDLRAHHIQLDRSKVNAIDFGLGDWGVNPSQDNMAMLSLILGLAAVSFWRWETGGRLNSTICHLRLMAGPAALSLWRWEKPSQTP